MVAIKVLNPGMFDDRRISKRFAKEARTLSRLVHPNIVTIHDVGQVDNCYYIVMEYLQDSLKERIRKKRRIPPEEALHFVIQIADALYYAHGKGIIHRDIKPENISFRKDGTPIVLDFGIAKVVDSRTKLTQTGMPIGTPHYMSPEQCSSQKLDGRSDIYSLGVVLYEMLTGKVPYTSKDTLSIVMKHLRDPVPVLPGDLNKFQLIIDKMMAKDRRKRVQSREELNLVVKKLLNLINTKTDNKKSMKRVHGKSSVSMTQVTVHQKANTHKIKEDNKAVNKPGKVESKKKKKSKTKFFLWFFVLFLAAIFVYQAIKGEFLSDIIDTLTKIFKAIGDFLF